jgi:hypothetical protein
MNFNALPINAKAAPATLLIADQRHDLPPGWSSLHRFVTHPVTFVAEVSYLVAVEVFCLTAAFLGSVPLIIFAIPFAVVALLITLILIMALKDR